jgi:hypothetical protein
MTSQNMKLRRLLSIKKCDRPTTTNHDRLKKAQHTTGTVSTGSSMQVLGTNYTEPDSEVEKETNAHVVICHVIDVECQPLRC